MANERHTIPYNGASIDEAIAWAVRYKDFDLSMMRPILGFLTADSESELPVPPTREQMVTGYLIDGELWLWNEKYGEWRNCGSIGGGGAPGTEVDPTVPSWAKQPTKPTYTASEVGALPDTTPIPDVSGKEDKMSIDSAAKTASFTAAVGKYYTVNVANDSSVTVTLPTSGFTATEIQSIVFLVTLGSGTASCVFSPVAMTAEGSLDASSTYEVNALWNGTGWYISFVKLVAST